MKKKLYVLGLAFLIITFLTIKGTYALFETNSTGNSNFQIGKWVIKLNNRDISLDKLITLEDFDIINSSHTENGYFAPGSKAEYEIDIDVSESDVSVEYDIDIDDSDLELYPNIHTKIIDLDNQTEMLSNQASGIITLGDTKVRKFKLELEWENIEEYDELDTSLIDGKLSISIKANFKQYLEG